MRNIRHIDFKSNDQYFNKKFKIQFMLIIDKLLILQKKRIVHC